MKQKLLAGVAALALFGCGQQSETQSSSAEENRPAQQAQAAAPELGDFGVETEYVDANVDPGDDFYRHVNAGWLDTFEIPEEFSTYGSFTVLFERSEERVRKIIEDAASGNNRPGSSEQKIGDFFSSYTDVDAINAAGLAPLADDLAAIEGLTTHEDVARLMARPDLAINSFLGAWVDIDSKQPNRYIVYLTQSGLGMPNRDYYLEDKFADKQAKYQDYIAEILTLAETPDAAAKAEAIYALEERMAGAHWEPAKRRNRDLTYNLKTLEELEAFAPGVPWSAMLDEAGLGAQRDFVVREDDALQNLASTFAETPVDTWKDYLRFHLLSGNANVLPEAFDDANFAFFGTELRGTPKKRERWKRGVAAVNGALGEAVGQGLCRTAFPGGIERADGRACRRT